MVGRAPHVCGEIGCTALVYGSARKCPNHTVAWANTGSSVNRSDTKARRTLRDKVFRRDGYLCRIRYPDICVGIAKDLDRVDNLQGYSMSNCQAACRPCHRRKSSYEGHAARGHRV